MKSPWLARWQKDAPTWFNTLRPRQNGRHFADDTFKRIFMNENVRISINISLKFVPKSLINNIPALVQIMAWRRSGDKPLSEPMMVRLLTHICVIRPQWVKPNTVRKSYPHTMHHWMKYQNIGACRNGWILAPRHLQPSNDVDGSCNSLAPTWHQAITWINNIKVCRRMYPGHNELKHAFCK